MAQLPEDLIVEILQRLPVKPVLRFRCLSKPLCAVIDSLDFINSHLCKSSQNFNLRKLIFSDRSEFHVFDVNLDLEEEILHLENPVSSPWGVVCDNCNGLLLLDHNFGLTLWNPSTRQRRDLPDCPFEQPACIIWSGLGYDDSVDDYKAFIMVCVERELEDEFHIWTYGLKSNIWRRIHNSPYLAYDFFAGMSTFADGSLHWISTPMTVSNGKRKDIVALDVGKETFSLVSQPIDSEVTCYSRLHVFEGCLCVCYLYDSTPSRSVLYMRKKDGVDKFTWTELFSVTEPVYWFKNLKLLGYSKSRDKILLDVGMAYMVSYDLTKKSFGNVQVNKDPTWKTPILCLESLVPVASGT